MTSRQNISNKTQVAHRFANAWASSLALALKTFSEDVSVDITTPAASPETKNLAARCTLADDSCLWILYTVESYAALTAAVSPKAPDTQAARQRVWTDLLKKVAASTTGFSGISVSECGPDQVDARATAFSVLVRLSEKALPEFQLVLSDAALVSFLADALSQPNRSTFDLLMDVELPLTVSFGRTYRSLREILSLTPGASIEMDCAPDSPVDLIVNNCTIARGEVVVVDGNYGIRITELASRQDRVLLQQLTGLNPREPMRLAK